MRTTLNINDDLAVRAKLLAVRQGTTLTALVEEGLKEVLAKARPGRLVLPVFGTGAAPEGFPWDKSEAGMVEFLEGSPE